jgi:hypothetical protein
MKVIPKLQQGNTIESDNTKVVRPEIHEPIKAKPRQYSIVDLGGEPSNDTRSAAERNRDYWHPIKGAKARFRASMSNETNPLVGIERTILPSAAGAALVTTPAAVVVGALGNMTVDKLTGGWGNWLEDKTGIPSEIGVYTNPGAWYGGAKGYKIGKDKLITKSIKGDADLAWNPINKNHWIFNKEARTPSNIAMATANRITPFLSKVEKLPLKVAAYKAAKRTNGNASVSLQDIKTMPADYTGSSILGGGNLEGRNLLAKYIFDENPVVKRMFFNKATSNIKPISRNEARRGFSHGDRYEQLYPGVHNRRYEMSAVVPSGRPLKFENVTKFTDYAGKNPISKVVGKETEPVMRMGDKEFMTFRQPGTDYIGPIDDVAGHLVKFQMNKGKLRQTSQDMWKFNPADYAKRWNDSPNTANQVRLIKQAALMDKVGRPFILQQSNPIWIEGKSVRNPELVTMAHGGRFDFKKSPLLKKQEEINGKRDMRKKFIKSSRPTYKKRIRKGQTGMRFVSYNAIDTPTIDYKDITNPVNPFSEYNYNTTYDKPTALVVPTREDSKPDTVEEPDVVANNPTVEPVINKPVASKVTYTPKSYKGLAAFNKAYDEVEASNPEAKKYRQFLTKMAEQESGFNSAIQNRAGAPAYGYFQFMQDDKKYNNIRQYAGTDIETFRNNPKLQIEAAIKLAKSFEKGFSKEDLELANKNGYSTWGLLGGAWLAGNGGVRKFLRGQGNPSDRHWNKEGKGTDVATRIKAFNFKEGGIVKYQEPAQPINRRDAIRDYRPNIPNRIRRATPAEHIQSMINIYGQSEQPTVTSDVKSPWQHQQAQEAASKGYDDYMQAKKYEEGLHNLNGILTFTDYATLATGLGSLLSKGASMAGRYAGKQMAKRAVGKEFKKGTKHLATPNNMLPNNVGWGPRQSIHVVHDTDAPTKLTLYSPERWDAIHEGAPEVGIWYQGKLGNPRTAANHSIPGKAEKAAKARERFAKRPYRVEGDLELERPIVTVGDVPNRAALERAADKMSADGVIFNNVYDNGYSNNQVIFSLRDDLKNGRVFKKGAKPKVDAYYPSKVYKRTVDDVNRDYLNFIEYIDNSETMQKLADIDKELGTQYVKAVTDFKEAAKQGKLRVKSPKPGTLDIQGYPIRNPQTLTHPDIMKNPSYDYIDIDILADFPPNSVGHEFKHAIENYQAALSGIKGSVDDALFANPRLQALMKDNIVSEDEFVASMVKRYPKNDIKEIRKVYKYLTDPGEFNAQLHPLIELEQRAGKSGLPNFKDADAVNQVIKQGRASGHGGSHLDILFNNLLKPDKREEFVKQFNKYGWSLAAPAIINNRE